LGSYADIASPPPLSAPRTPPIRRRPSSTAVPKRGAACVRGERERESNRQRRRRSRSLSRHLLPHMPAREKFVTSPRCFIPPRNHPLLAPVASRSMFLVLGCLPRSVPRLAARTLRLLANVTLCVWLSRQGLLLAILRLSGPLSRRARCTLYLCCVSVCVVGERERERERCALDAPSYTIKVTDLRHNDPCTDLHRCLCCYSKIRHTLTRCAVPKHPALLLTRATHLCVMLFFSLARSLSVP
jgi:hypothetical protein